MQALRDLIGGADLSIFGDAWRDLPQRILHSAGASSSSADGGVRQARVFGETNYNFSLHFEPRSQGGGLCQTGVLVAAAKARNTGASVPISCMWKRRVGAHHVEIPGIKDSVYHLSADDVGVDIICVATPTAREFSGQAVGVLGSFQLDPSTRMSLENLLASGASRFPVRHFRDQNEMHARDLQLQVTEDCVKVLHPVGAGGSHEDVARYTAEYPKVMIHPTDQLKFIIELDKEQLYHFVALSRPSRDLIALLVRCFHSRKYVANSYILGGLFQNPATPGAPPTALPVVDLSIERLCGKLGRELDRNAGKLESLEKVLRNAKEEKRQLQAQLKETIGSYTEAIERFHQQIADSRGGPAQQLQLRLHDVKAQHQRLQMEMQELSSRIEEESLRHADTDATRAKENEVKALRTEIAKLRSSISTLAGSSKQASESSQRRAEELRRLRQDVENLSGEKDGLERLTKQSDQEKQDLVDNFLYVKGCLDKLQMASLELPACSPEVEREVVQLKSSYSQAVDDRNRLAARIEALDRDREKQKGFRENALERVMNVNARLLEERDRLEKEKTRVSELYQRTMGHLGANASAGGYPGAAGASSACSSAPSLEALRAELRANAELLAKAEQEGESLRTRLRKLAMA